LEGLEGLIKNTGDDGIVTAHVEIMIVHDFYLCIKMRIALQKEIEELIGRRRRKHGIVTLGVLTEYRVLRNVMAGNDKKDQGDMW
jgi:hypothetical protein